MIRNAVALFAVALSCCSFDTRGLLTRDATSTAEAGQDRSRFDARSDAPPLDRLGERPLGDLPGLDLGPGDSKLPLEAKPVPDTKPPPDTGACAGQVCALGCHAAGRCNRIAATNGQSVVAAGYDQVTAGLTVSGIVTISTGNGAISGLRGANLPGLAAGIYWGTVAQATGHRELSVFVVKSLTVAQGGSLRIVGTRPAVLYVLEGATISGTVISSPERPGAGAGGYGGGDLATSAPACFGGGGKTGSTWGNEDSGGGGGGRKAAGGAGGDGGFEAGGSAGSANGAATLVPLYGGCGGGGGAGASGGPGGGGGGALQLVVNGGLTVAAGGTITMPGAGGAAAGGGGAGGGGGSGGAIFLEAAALSLSGALAANGGGGGGGGSSASDGGDGTSGTTGGGGGGAGDWGAGGGAGGGLSKEPGSAGPGASYNGGGGGGGVGRIRLAAPTIKLGGTVSPAADQTSAVAVW